VLLIPPHSRRPHRCVRFCCRRIFLPRNSNGLWVNSLGVQLGTFPSDHRGLITNLRQSARSCNQT
jgi:hypothetical protein